MKNYILNNNKININRNINISMITDEKQLKKHFTTNISKNHKVTNYSIE